MKKFWKSKNSSPRSWEEITAPKIDKLSEETVNVDDENNVEGEDNSDTVDDKGDSKDRKEAFAKAGKELRKKSSEKFGKMIDNLEFDPTVYYGWGEGKIDALMQKLTKAWNVFASVLWFIFGSITFAPILFTANKIDKFFNDKKKSFLISAIIYLVAIIFLFVLILF